MNETKIRGCRFQLDGRTHTLNISNSLFSYAVPDTVSVSVSESDAGGLSLPFVCGEAKRTDGSVSVYSVWEDLAAVRVEHAPAGELLTLPGEHWTVRAVRLYSFTDNSDSLTVESEYYLMERRLSNTPDGNIFFFEDAETGDARILISEAPDYVENLLTVRGGKVFLKNDGNPVIVGFCRAGECEALCRDCCRHICRPKTPFAMSNTWGDRNGFSRVCDDFVRREMDAGADIGIDIVQIDDGWQEGNTATVERDEKNRRIFRDPFWELQTPRFPAGMRSVADYAAAKGLKTGLWFAPDAHDAFSRRARDKEVLRRAYEEWGIRFFKLDMFWLENDADKEGMLDILSYIYSLGSDVAVQLDVTRGPRLGYLCGTRFGTLFVENRYTRSANSFPHRILRNLWNLGRFIPTTKFQFELINPTLNAECYAPSDPFAPSRFTMDYLFAVTMLSNPLFWMEMQFLPEKERSQLAPVMKVWKEHRAAFADADVIPIGERPSGRSLTGFRVRAKACEYLLLFREVTDRAVMELPASAAGRITVLASNGDVRAETAGGTVRVFFPEERTYALLQISD